MRIPLTPALSTKDGSANKNARMTNMLRERNKAVIRPGLTEVSNLGGIGEGLIPFNGQLVNIVGETAYIDSDIVHYFGETSLDRWRIDFTGTGLDNYNNTLVYSGATYDSNGVYFANATDYVKITGSEVNLGTAWTMECRIWVFTPPFSTADRFLMAAQNAAQVGISFELYNDKFYLYLSSNGTTDNIASIDASSTVVVDNQPQHVALVRDPDTQYYYLYYKGVLVWSKQSALEICGGINEITIGNRSDHNFAFKDGRIMQAKLATGCEYPGGITFAPHPI